MFTKKIHVFRAGDQTSAQGVQRNFSPKDLDQVVKTYDPSIHEAPLVIGHSGDNDSTPAYGWIQGFTRKGDNLYADVAFTDAAKDLVKDGHYRKVSISFYSPDSAINPHKGKWTARHLALLGASPPAVKGLEPFNFREVDGVFDYAVALAPSDIFDDELGPTILSEQSPLQMLQEKLNSVREDVSSAVKDLQASSQNQQSTQNTDVATSSATTQPETAQMANPESTQYSENQKKQGREGTEITQQTAGLENQFPEEEFMDQGSISRKRAKGANGQVMQVVENVYDEAHKESSRDRKAAADRSEEAKRQTKEGRPGAARETEELEEMETKHKELHPNQLKLDKNKNGKLETEDFKHLQKHGPLKKGEHPMDHAELEYDEVSYKTNPSQGVVKFGKKSEADDDDDTGRYETARSASDGYVDRMKTGKQGPAGNVERMKTAKSGEQDRDRMNTAESDEQDADRLHTAKARMADADGASRWAGQQDGYDQVSNMDQYDAGLSDYPDGVQPKMSTGTDPYGRDETETKMPTESEEMPDDEVFAVGMTNVMSDKNMRVLRQKSSDARAKSVSVHNVLYAEGPEADEMTTEDGVTTAKKSMKGSKMIEHAEYDQGEGGGGSLDSLREEIGDGKKSKNKQLIPGAMDDTDTPGQIVGPDGAFAESYKGEPKSKARQLTPGAMDETDEENQVTGPDGVFGEASLESLRENIGDGKKSNKKQLTPGAQGELDDPAQVTMRSGGVTGGADHGEGCGGGSKKNPYSKTGFGSTYDEDDGGGDEEGDDFSEPAQMYEQLMRLKQEHSELQRAYRQEKINARRDKISNFVEALYEEGRLTDGIMPQDELQSYCEGLEFGTLEFSEGETAASKLLGLLSKLPPMVSFAEVANGTFQYAEADLDPHAKALKMVEESDGKIDYVEALKKTMFS